MTRFAQHRTFLFSLLWLGLAFSVAAGKEPEIETIVVAQQSLLGRESTSPAEQSPVSYVAFEGGFIEAGDPSAGETIPAPDAVARALHSALLSRQYVSAPTESLPALVLTYHWGVLRPERHHRSAGPNDPYLEARLFLLAPARIARDVADARAQRRIGGAAPIVGIDHNDLLALFDDSRYFFILTAYDHASLARGEVAPVWRVRVSAVSTAASMQESIVAMAHTAVAYAGQTLNRIEYTRSALRPANDSTASLPAAFNPSAEARGIDPTTLSNLLREEHQIFAGERSHRDDERRWTKKPARRTSVITADLQRKISAYQQEKQELRARLVERLKSVPPGEQTRREIDVFNREHASRLSDLEQSREAIRSELARFASQQQAPGDRKTLDALLKEFAQGTADAVSPP